MSNNPKPRPPRLRASCDGCFLAKVKCSKARPMCSRCLACGLECRYSPSSRAGKPKSDGFNNRPSSGAASASQAENKYLAFVPGPVPDLNAPYKLEPGRNTPFSIDVAMSRDPSISSDISVLAISEGFNADQTVYFTARVPWTPTDFPGGPYADMSMAAANMPGHHSRSPSMDAAFSAQLDAWVDTAAQETMYFSSPGSVQTPSSATSAYIPSPALTSTLQLDMKPRTADVDGASPCTCFSSCLESLQALHLASSPDAPPFDIVLSLNRKAVEGCAAMLACTKCLSRSDNTTTAMLLATVIGKITSFYKNASNLHFEPTNSGGGGCGSPAGKRLDLSGGSNTGAAGFSISLGAYTIAGEEGRWLELEILARELRKLEEVYSQFCQVCAELTDDSEVSRAMIRYLSQSLGSTLEDINYRRGVMGVV